MNADSTTTFLVQYRATEHDKWQDDTLRAATLSTAQSRLANCKASKIMKGSKFRLVSRTDTVIE